MNATGVKGSGCAVLCAALLLAPAWGVAQDSLATPAPLRVNYTQPARSGAQMPLASRVVVHKSARRLELLRGGEVLRSYMLTRRNPRSDFFLSIQVSYPSAEDIRRARKNGLDPGGAIMIHGMPNRLRHDPDYYLKRDWTDGCIAVSNSDMVEIWLLTQDDIPIDILP
jgi:hypothetical protein